MINFPLNPTIGQQFTSGQTKYVYDGEKWNLFDVAVNTSTPNTSIDNSLVRFDGTTGRLFQNSTAILSDDGRLTNIIIDSITNKVGSNHIHYKVKATTALTKGTVVKLVGYNVGEGAYEVAAVSSATDIAIGIIDSTLASGAFGAIINTGMLEDIDTSAFAVGTILYPNTSGGFTSTKPASGTYQAIAFVIRSHANNGAIIVEASEPTKVTASANVASTVVERDGSGNFSAGTITANLTGNAATATKLSTARTISLTGDVTYTSSSFDGSANVTGSATLANSGVTAGTYNNVTVDAKGRVSAGSNVSYLTTNQNITLSGDVTGSGTTGITATLSNTGVVAGTYNNVTVNAKGRVTTGSNVNYLTTSSSSIISDSSITPSITVAQYNVTALAVAATINAPATGLDGQQLKIRLKDDGTARALTWVTSTGGFRAIGVTLPTTTTAGKVTYIGCIYNSQDSFWDVVAVGTQA